MQSRQLKSGNVVLVYKVRLIVIKDNMLHVFWIFFNVKKNSNWITHTDQTRTQTHWKVLKCGMLNSRARHFNIKSVPPETTFILQNVAN